MHLKNSNTSVMSRRNQEKRAPEILLSKPDEGHDGLHEMAIVFDNVPDALLLLTRSDTTDWIICGCNRTAVELFHCSRQQMIGMSLDEIFGAGAICRDGRPVPDLCVETGSKVEQECYLGVRGSDFWVELNWWHFEFIPLPSERGSAPQVAAIAQLITKEKQLRQSLKQFSSAIEQAASIIAILELDGTVVYINQSFESVTGYARSVVTGGRSFDYCMPPGSADVYAPMITAMEKLESWQGELPAARQDGSIYWEHVRISPIQNDEGVADHYLMIKEDITERRIIDIQLKLASRVLETTDAGVIIANNEGCITSVNPAFEAITGYTHEESVGRPPKFLQSGVHDADFYAKLWQALIHDGHWIGELVDRRKDGSTFVARTSISALYSPSGETTNYVSVFSDITDLKESQRQMELLANYDALTGLPNRLQLHDRLRQALARARRDGRMVAVMFFDLDHFKAVNDTLGHAAGDALLKEVSARALKQLRDEDTLARLGGDEFVAILEGVVSPERIAVVAERVINSIGLKFDIQGQEVFVGCSIGISFFPKDGEDSESLLRSADLALYLAKAEGRNCYRMYSDELNTNAHQRYQIEVRLRRAIEKHELGLVYQPQFDTVNRHLIGAEALLRWTCADAGNIPPSTFIPIAEQTGVILPIGLWVLEQACRFQARVIATGLTPVPVSVNVSPVQFRQKDLVQSFERVVLDAGIPPGSISVEVTESAIMENPDNAIEILQRLRALGFTIAVDDFGTGYSSLYHLKRLPIDKLKIDRAFVSDLETDPDDAVIISAIVAMSHRLGLKTLAEGVETEAQLNFLNQLECGEFQGFLLGKPQPETAFLQLLGHHQCDLLIAEQTVP